MPGHTLQKKKITYTGAQRSIPKDAHYGLIYGGKIGGTQGSIMGRGEWVKCSVRTCYRRAKEKQRTRGILLAWMDLENTILSEIEENEMSVKSQYHLHVF